MKKPLIKKYNALSQQRRYITLNQKEKSMVYVLVIVGAFAGVIAHPGQSINISYIVAAILVAAFCGIDLLANRQTAGFFKSHPGLITLALVETFIPVLFILTADKNQYVTSLIFSFCISIEILAVTNQFKWVLEIWTLIVASLVHILLNISLIHGYPELVIVPAYLVLLIVTILWLPIRGRHVMLSRFSLNITRLQKFHSAIISGVAILVFLLVFFLPIQTINQYLFAPYVNMAKRNFNYLKNRQIPDATGGLDELSIADRSSLMTNDDIVITVQLTKGNITPYHPNKTFYLRGKVFEEYDKGRWLSKSSLIGKYLEAASQKEITLPENLPAIKYEWLGQNISVTDKYEDVIYAIPEPYLITGFKLIKRAENGVLMKESDFRSSYDYKVRSAFPDYQSDLLKKVASARTNALYTAFPSNLDKIQSLSRQITANKNTFWDKASALKDYLSSNYAYTLDVTETERSEPVEEFLLIRKNGYCVHFASAMVLLLRAANVPCRLSTGFLMYEYNPTTGSYFVRNRNAHAWAEVYFGPTYGWVPFDPTPPAADMPGQPDITADTNPTPLPPPSKNTSQGQSESPWPVILVIILISILIIYGMAATIKRNGKIGFFKLLSAERRLSTIKFYNEFLISMRHRGMPKPASLTPKEFSERITASGPIKEDALLITNAFYAVKYGGYGLTPALYKPIKEALFRLKPKMKPRT